MGERYAVLISGDVAENGFPEFFFDVVLMRRTLLDAGFAAGNIFVLYGDGADYSNAAYPAARYRPSPAITDAAATSSNVLALFDDLAHGSNGRPQLTDDDLLVVWTFDHGNVESAGGGTIATLCLRDADMRADTFAAAVDAVPYGHRVILMQQCFSGGFIPHLANDRTVVLTAATGSEVAFPTDDSAETETISGTVYPHGEFNFYLFAALNQADLLGGAVASDADGNGWVTMREVFDVIAANESGPPTPQYDDGARALGRRLHLAFADVFLRDNLTDTGLEPTPGGGLSISPDLHHFRDELADPAGTLLGGSALTSGALFEAVEFGQPNYLYARAHNRGYGPSAAQLSVYWTPPSTLPTPASWHPIGVIELPEIGPGQHCVGGPLPWPSDEIPPGGHYCFVGVLGNAQDPAPPLTGLASVGAFQDLVRSNNNVVWKNFDVEDVFAGGYATLRFHVQGWPRRQVDADLEVDLQALPDGVLAKLRLLGRLADAAELEHATELERHGRFVTLRLQPGRVAAVRGIPLPPSDDTQAELTLAMAPDMPDGAYDVSVRQLVDGAEAGRVTRRLAVGDHPYTGNLRTREVHRSQCDWVSRMAAHHRVAYPSAQRAVAHGFDGCRFCLPELSAD